MTDVLAHYYPKWLANCKESVRWLESGEGKTFCLARNLPWSDEDCLKKIAYYRAKVLRYEALIAGGPNANPR